MMNACLALQGGGAHGAFAWGVADWLLENGVHPARISGVSSGALLGMAIAQGWAKGGAQGARSEMRLLWTRIGQGSPQAGWLGHWDISGLAWHGLDVASRLFSPSQFNPLGHHPLRPVVTEILDPDALRAPGALSLSIAATDVETGEAVLFDNAAISVDVLLASCCLPFIFPPVEINGRYFWDGGFSGNPPLAPLLQPGLPPHILLVRAQPKRRQGVPTLPAEITNRMHELAFQGVLEAELAALPATTRLTSYDADAALGSLPLSSKVHPSPDLLERLFQAGRETARQTAFTDGP